MKLDALVFDDTVTVFAGKDVGGGLSRQDLRESSFRAEDGWSLLRLEKGVYSIHRDGMPKATIAEGYGASYLEADAPVVVEQPRKGKR